MATEVGVREALKMLQGDEVLSVSLTENGTFHIAVTKKGGGKSPEKGGIQFADRSPKRVRDKETGKVYQSMSKCGRDLISLVRDRVKPGQENFAWYYLVKRYPDRFEVL